MPDKGRKVRENENIRNLLYSQILWTTYIGNIKHCVSRNSIYKGNVGEGKVQTQKILIWPLTL